MSTKSKVTKTTSTVVSGAPTAVGGRRQRQKRKSSKSMQNSGGAIPAAVNVPVRWTSPLTTQLGNASIRVRHREFLREISSQSAFTVTTLAINPGLSTTFPWLSGIARQYETYTFNNLLFEYVPSVGTSVSGAISMSMDFDSADLPPQNKQALLAAQGAVRASVWSPVSLKCSQGDLKKFAPQRYTRMVPLAAGLDIKTYDVGNLHVSASSALGEQTMVGDLFVCYDVTFQTPQVSNESPYNVSARATAETPVCSLEWPLGHVVGTVSDLPAGVVRAAPEAGDFFNIQSGVAQGFDILFKKPGEYLLDLDIGGTGIPADPRPSLTVPLGSGIETSWCEWLSKDAIVGHVQLLIKIIAVGSLIGFRLNPAISSVHDVNLRLSPYLKSLG